MKRISNIFIKEGIRGSKLENVRQHIGYENIIFTPNSAEAHKPLLLRTAGGRGGSERQRGRREK